MYLKASQLSGPIQLDICAHLLGIVRRRDISAAIGTPETYNAALAMIQGVAPGQKVRCRANGIAHVVSTYASARKCCLLLRGVGSNRHIANCRIEADVGGSGGTVSNTAAP